LHELKSEVCFYYAYQLGTVYSANIPSTWNPKDERINQDKDKIMNIYKAINQFEQNGTLAFIKASEIPKSLEGEKRFRNLIRTTENTVSFFKERLKGGRIEPYNIGPGSQNWTDGRYIKPLRNLITTWEKGTEA